MQGNVKVVGLKQVNKKLQSVAKKLPKGSADAINKSLIEINNKISSNLTGKILKIGPDRGGTLRRSYNIRQAKPKKLSGMIGSKLIYAKIHEYGGIIRVKRAKYLRFKTRDGLWHSVKQVKIPARKYFSKSVEATIPKIHKIFDAMIKKAIR